MSQSAIKRNFAYKSILTISTYVVGIVIYPYISRVFGVERLGLVNFVDNTINYFLLFASMGIGMLGVREIATVKDDKNRCSKVFSNILGLNILFTCATLIIYFILITIIPKLNQYSELFYIGCAKIIFTGFLIEWFYTGIENFKYITIRSVIIKLLYVILVFLFVRAPGDYILYFIFTVGVVVINAIINLLYVKRYIDVRFKELCSLRYLKDNIRLGVYAIMTSMYLTFNVMYLGLVSDNIQVGYYTTAFKLYQVILGFFTAFTSVMLPRMSALLSEGNDKLFQNLIERSLSAVATLAIPLIMYSVVMSPQIIYVLSGPGYDGAILPMRIIMPAVLCVGIAQVLAIQILMPTKKDNVLLLASILGAVVSVCVNVFVVPTLLSVGSAIVMLSAEIVVTGIYIIYIMKNKLIIIPIKKFVRTFFLSIPLFVLLGFGNIITDNSMIFFIISSCVLCISFVLYYIVKFKVLRSGR